MTPIRGSCNPGKAACDPALQCYATPWQSCWGCAEDTNTSLAPSICCSEEEPLLQPFSSYFTELVRVKDSLHYVILQMAQLQPNDNINLTEVAPCPVRLEIIYKMTWNLNEMEKHGVIWSFVPRCSSALWPGHIRTWPAARRPSRLPLPRSLCGENQPVASDQTSLLNNPTTCCNPSYCTARQTLCKFGWCKSNKVRAKRALRCRNTA